MPQPIICTDCWATINLWETKIRVSEYSGRGMATCPHCGSPELDWTLLPGADAPKRTVDLGEFEKLLG